MIKRTFTHQRISVALCTHNGRRFIREQLRSILAQSMPVDEIVLGDDASTDGTVEIILEELASAPVDLVVRCHAVPLGVRGNFSDAIASTTGDIVFLCDQDDRWHPDKVERLVEALQNVELVHSDAELINGEGNPLGRRLLTELVASHWELENLERGDALAVLLKRNLVTGATTAVRGDFAREAMPVPEGWIHDEWLALLAALDHSLLLIPECFTDYRQHENNQIGARRESIAHRVARMLAPDPDDDRWRLARALSASRIANETGRGSPMDRARLDEAAYHQRVRNLMPDGRIARISPILQEGFSGRYARCSRGVLTMGRDLFQSK